MRKYIFPLVLSILFSLTAHSQYGWIQQQTNTDNAINGIAFCNQYTGIAVGMIGTVLNTTNGGANWTLSTVNNVNFQNVVYPGSDTAIVVGYPGACYKSTNSGLNWFTVFTSWSDIYTYSYFLDQNTGWILAYYGRVYKTTNGGYNWEFQMANTNANLNSCSFANANTGWVAGDFGMVSKTTNGGDYWLNMPVGMTNHLNGVYFINENTGWLSCDGGLVLKTTNGGLAWKKKNSGVTNNLTWVHFLNANTGYMCGTYGLVIKTTNGGDKWYQQQVATSQPLKRITFINNQTGWVCGFYGAIFKTTNGGEPMPVAPMLISPPDNTIGVSVTPTLTWTNTYPTNYNVQVSRTPDFSTITDSATVSQPDYTVPAGKLNVGLTYYWRVRANYYYGTSAWSVVWNFTTLTTGLTYLNSTVPADYKLYQNYPNPFNPSTNIRFDVPKVSNVKLTVYDIDGREVESLFSGNVIAGSFEYKWNASKYSSGLYFVKMESKEFTTVKKMTLLK